MTLNHEEMKMMRRAEGGKVSLFSPNSMSSYLEPSLCWASRSYCLSPARSLVLGPEASLGDTVPVLTTSSVSSGASGGPRHSPG